MTTSDGAGLVSVRGWAWRQVRSCCCRSRRPALAHPLHDTTRVLAQEGNACVGGGELQGHRVRAAADQGRQAPGSGALPDARPYRELGRDFHEHIGIRLVERRPGGLIVVAINQPTRPDGSRCSSAAPRTRPPDGRDPKSGRPADPGAQERRAVSATTPGPHAHCRVPFRRTPKKTARRITGITMETKK